MPVSRVAAGLATTPAATGLLLLNVEAVFTAVIAWVGFRENVDAQVFAGMVAIVIGGVLLSWQPGAAAAPAGALLIAAACACWAIDNHLTRHVPTHDAVLLACVKGLVAGPVNLGLALLHGAALPAAHALFAAMLTGFGAYGLSLVLFFVALRHLGTARTGAYWHTHRHTHRHQHDFSSDGREPHRHPHRHAPITHTHAHYPDIHHRHRH